MPISLVLRLTFVVIIIIIMIIIIIIIIMIMIMIMIMIIIIIIMIIKKQAGPPLHLACYNGQFEIAELLLSNSANQNITALVSLLLNC